MNAHFKSFSKWKPQIFCFSYPVSLRCGLWYKSCIWGLVNIGTIVSSTIFGKSLCVPLQQRIPSINGEETLVWRNIRDEITCNIQHIGLKDGNCILMETLLYKTLNKPLLTDIVSFNNGCLLNYWVIQPDTTLTLHELLYKWLFAATR